MNLDGHSFSDPQKKIAKTLLDKYGYSEGDFDLVRTEDSSLNEEADGHVAKTVYIIYRPTGFRRMYDGANWEAEFEEDLKNNIFKSGS